jgi:mitogen-activated protein kinase 1/3
MNEEHVITILYNILCAVNLMHSSNVMHRDIKPANILLDDQCGVKICDFGMARVTLKKSDLDRKLDQLTKKLHTYK